MFASGQAYTSMSRVPFWDQIDIHSFDINHVKVDRDVINEYRRLNVIFQNGLRPTLY
jgi:hypothetical protein